MIIIELDIYFYRAGYIFLCKFWTLRWSPPVCYCLSCSLTVNSSMGKGNSQVPMLGLLLPPSYYIFPHIFTSLFCCCYIFVCCCCFFFGGGGGGMGGYIRLMHMSPFCPPPPPSLSLMFSFFFFFFLAVSGYAGIPLAAYQYVTFFLWAAGLGPVGWTQRSGPHHQPQPITLVRFYLHPLSTLSHISLSFLQCLRLSCHNKIKYRFMQGYESIRGQLILLEYTKV